MKSFTAFAAFALLASAAAQLEDYTYIIDPSKPSGEGGDLEVDCLDLVQPGESCYLMSGDHMHDGLTQRHGEEDNRILITGDTDACIKGSNTQDRALQIAHNWYTIENICFDGNHGDEHVATAVYVLGADRASTSDESHGIKSAVTGLQMFNLEIKNFDEECIHLRYFVTFTEIRGCSITDCGKHSFSDGGGGAVGEGVYVGTALDQVDDNKAPEPKLRSGSADNVDADVCQKNWIHQNTIRTNGNECVDVKEGSTHNVIENNICEKQRDENSGCFGARGSDNCFRHNDIAECVGACVRFGGDKGYGTGNNCYGNTMEYCDYGAFNIMAEPQGKICDNEISNVDVVTQGAEKLTLDTDVVTGACADNTEPDVCHISELMGDTDGGGDVARSDGGDDAGSDSGDDAGSNDDGGGDDSGSVVPLQEETDDETECAGLNCVDEEEEPAVPEEDKIVEIQTNSNAGLGGVDDQCLVVLSVVNLKVEHLDDSDSDTFADNLFDGDLETHYSVNRADTEFTMELEQDAEIDGISIGFFMKNEGEVRVQTFSVEVRASNDPDYSTVIARKESSGEMGGVQHFSFTSQKAQYIRLSTHGNTFNNWSAFTEVQICGKAAEENALFGGGVRAAKNEIAQLAGEEVLCPNGIEKLEPEESRATGEDNVLYLFDGNFETRWTTEETQNSNDLDNAKVMLEFLGDMTVTSVKIAFFDGHLAKPYFSLYKESASEKTWTPLLEGEVQVGAKTESFQEFVIGESGVNVLSIVGKGNAVGERTKISEIEVYGC